MNIVKKSIGWKVNILLPYLKKSENVLDFGCGDLSLSESLKAVLPTLQITGVDVADFKNKNKNIKFILYDGKRLPFGNNSFDVVISFYVFHHCDDAVAAFEECLRVGKRVIIVESVYRHPLEIPFMKFMDWIYNRFKSESVSLSYQFFSHKDWMRIFSENKLKVISCRKNNQIFLPSILPIGISYVFEVVKKN